MLGREMKVSVLEIQSYFLIPELDKHPLSEANFARCSQYQKGSILPAGQQFSTPRSVPPLRSMRPPGCSPSRGSGHGVSSSRRPLPTVPWSQPAPLTDPRPCVQESCGAAC